MALSGIGHIGGFAATPFSGLSAVLARPAVQDMIRQRRQAMDPRFQRRQRAAQYNTEMVGLEQEAEKERQRREQAAADVDRAYANPERMAGLERLYGANLSNQLAGLQQGYRQQSQSAGLAAARRGRLGSSFDTETQSGLRHGFESDVMGAERRSAAELQELKDADENQRLSLRRAILSGDPQTAAALQAQAGGIGLDVNRLLREATLGEEATRRRQAEQAQGYQTLGDVLSSAGTGVRNYNYYAGY